MAPPVAEEGGQEMVNDRDYQYFLVDEGHDTDVFVARSLDNLFADIEPVDVRNEEYSLYRLDGARGRLVVVGDAIKVLGWEPTDMGYLRSRVDRLLSQVSPQWSESSPDLAEAARLLSEAGFGTD